MAGTGSRQRNGIRITRRGAIAGLTAAATMAPWPALSADVPKFALLVGNRDYPAGVGTLRNPGNDVKLVSSSLAAAGFPAERIVQVANAKRQDLLNAIGEHVRQLKAAGPDAIGFFYYCGHGAAHDGRNYIIPIDVTDARTNRLWLDSLGAEEIFSLLSGFDGAQVAAFDCCRNELELTGPEVAPIGSTGTASGPIAPSGSKGLANLRGQAPKRNMLISYASWEGETASDGKDEATQGPYAVAFDAAVRSKAGALPLVGLFDQVRLRVLAATGDMQEPMNLSRMSAASSKLKPFAAAAASRVAPLVRQAPCALVISNSYASWAGRRDLSLPFTALDGDLVAGALNRSGFEVRREKDLARDKLVDVVGSFASKAEGRVAVIYFSGYGAGLNGMNHLMPDGPPISSPEELEAGGVAVLDIVARMLKSKVRALFIALDSSRRFSVDVGARGIEDAIESMGEVEQTQPNVVISYSAAANTFAHVQRDRSPYAAALASRIQQPARRSLQAIANQVKADVLQATGQKQRPWFQSASQVPVYFRDEQGLQLLDE